MDLETITQVSDLEYLGQIFFWVFGTIILGIGMADTIYKGRMKKNEMDFSGDDPN